MRLQLTVLLSLALTALALPAPEPCNNNEVVALSDDFSSLPESGQLVFPPTHFGDDAGDYKEFIFEDEGLSLDDSAYFADWKTEVVNQHNSYRARYGAPPVTWSDALYPATQQWADQCRFQHSNSGGKWGENLAAGTGNAYGFSNAMKSWMDEASKYDYNKPGFTPGTGHFTQVVWKSSRQVACAMANCRGGTIFQQPSKYVVCRYSPPGNFAGRFQENVGRPRS
ncbi:hypothetical protein AX16_005453 [Volvariella volvacea WC 439]|nr:hypothetical protein AX16_005453 [Volvariella volvacea WC 439]